MLPLYEPMRLAEDLIVLDHVSGGRTMTVLALGYRPVEYELHGVDYERRGQIADEKLAALLDALTRDGRHAAPVLVGRTSDRVGWWDEGRRSPRRSQRARLLRADESPRTEGDVRTGGTRRGLRTRDLHSPVSGPAPVGLRQRRPRRRLGGSRSRSSRRCGALPRVERGGRERRLHREPVAVARRSRSCARKAAPTVW